jgi:hypothetical protein
MVDVMTGLTAIGQAINIARPRFTRSLATQKCLSLMLGRPSKILSEK